MARQRKWMAHILRDEVVVRHYAVLAPGEDLTETPPTVTMSLAEWQTRHTEFDCNVDGSPRTPAPGVGMPADPEQARGAARRALAGLSPQERAQICAENPRPDPAPRA